MTEHYIKFTAITVGFFFFAGVSYFVLRQGSIMLRGGRVVRGTETQEFWGWVSLPILSTAVCAVWQLMPFGSSHVIAL
jgi:hypothetical protein